MVKTNRLQCSACGTEQTIHCNKRKRNLPLATVDVMKADAAPSAVPKGKPVQGKEKSLSATAPLKSAPVVPAARKKSRAKNAGLQALLEKSRIESTKPAGFGLDLKDFMKT
ncbi:hypothetical protein B0A48_05046 [Cryoendolithus antarcticus]|uniref:Uncharacterized protein n=1 Tax=Cryoendolithus antarcticus TaxID=1507870 RepID=A0A1V8TEE7_9PEZI|nr:hypothetical protein B0A48_05046 [Cryoendolithus antarcticus]